MVQKTKARKLTKSYYLKNCIEPMEYEGRYICPWCRSEPKNIVLYIARLGIITFLKQCSTCGSYIKIERYTSEI